MRSCTLQQLQVEGVGPGKIHSFKEVVRQVFGSASKGDWQATEQGIDEIVSLLLLHWSLIR